MARHPLWLLPTLWLLGLTSCNLTGCNLSEGAHSAGAGRSGDEPWNVLLVTFDTTRADRIRCYGNERIQTPTLDALAADGVRFRRALSAIPITAPSHSTILTGRYPIAHGVRDNGLFRLGDEQVTLAEILRAEGYATGAAVGAFPVTAQFGLDQGFDHYDDHLTGVFENYLGRRVEPKERLFFDERRAAQVNEAILPWLTENARDPVGRPFFAWVHYFDPHQPFEPAPPYDQLYADSLYDGEIAYADSRLGFLLGRLEALGELDRTLVVMTADHGEGLGEHNELTHAILAYNSTLHVPLILRPPGDFPAAGTVVDPWVGTVDIVPTILDLLGLETPEGVQGTSLVPLWQGGRLPRRSTVRYAENLSPRLTHGWGELRVLFEGGRKYIHGPEPELYDLESDPHELHDLAAEQPDEAARMKRNLQIFLDRQADAGASSTETMDEEVRRRLESLGYLHSSGAGPETIVERLRSDGIPPRQRVGDLNHLSAAKQLIFDGRGRDALVHTQKLLEWSPETPLYLELHASALALAGRWEEAWSLAEELASAGQLPEVLMLQITSARFAQGDPEGAVAQLTSYSDSQPSAHAYWMLASFHKELGDIPAARRALDQSLAAQPAFAPARVDLAVQMARSGDSVRAEEEFRRALSDAPYYAKARYNYGTFLLQEGRYEESTGFFRRAVEIAPGYLAARLALVASHMAAGKDSRAREAYESLRSLAPDSAETALAAELLADS